MNKKFLLIPATMLMAISSCSSNASHIYTSNDPSSSVNHAELFNGYKDYLLNQPNKSFNSKVKALDPNYVSSVQSFASDFYKVIQDEENKIFSPLSIATCFSMLLDGAANNSRKELENMLHYDDSFNHLDAIKDMLLNLAIKDEKGVYLDIAQSFWVDNCFKDTISQEYVNKLTEYYFAEAFQGVLKSQEMHQALANYINDKTNEFFHLTAQDFVDFAGVLWLVNTIYTNSEWVNEFPERNNYEGTFYNLDKTTSQVTYMNRSDEQGRYYKGENYVISTLALKHGLNFNILLPNKDADAKAVLSSKDALNNMFNFNNLRLGVYGNTVYTVPKFEGRSKYDLIEILPNLGVRDIFGTKADLSPIGADGLYVSKAIHEAGIKVDNKGVEAAAYTIIEVEKGVAAPDVEITLNHPFAYSISDSNGLPLFVGVINKF